MQVELQDESTHYYSLGNENEFEKRPVSDLTEIWQCPKTGAKSLHARSHISLGDILSQLGCREIVDSPTYLSVQVNDEKHILLDPLFLQYINHSCDPNTFFDTTNMEIVCLKDIKPGEAITFFYPSTEWAMDQAFNCLCGSKECLRRIQGAKYLSSDVLRQYRLSDHIKKKL